MKFFDEGGQRCISTKLLGRSRYLTKVCDERVKEHLFVVPKCFYEINLCKFYDKLLESSSRYHGIFLTKHWRELSF